MNHVYRVIWSKVKHCYVVVSEIAKRNGKSSSKVSRAGITALALLGTISLGTSVYADSPTGNPTLTADQEAVYKAVLHELENNGVHYVSVKGTSKDADTNFNNDGAKGNGAIAIGEKAKSTNSSDIAIGSEANSAGGWGIAIGEKAKSKGSIDIAIGNEANSAGGWGMAIGANAKNTAQLGMAIGYATKVTSAHGLALGVQASTSGEDAISIGTNVSSSAKRGIAVGTNSNVAATAARGIAIGDGAYVGAVTDTHKGTAMPKPGDEWKPDMPFQPKNDDTKPEEYNKTPQENSLAIGMRASAFGYQNVAIGAAAEAHDTNSTAVGVAAVAKGHHSTALGKQARTYGQETTSVGHWADTRDEFATALGAKSIAYKKGATALGSNARAYDENSVAIGANSIAKEAVDGNAVYTNEEVKAAAGIVSVGHPDYKVGDKEVKANYRRIVNVAGGISAHDAVNVAQLKAVAVHYISVNSTNQDADSNYKNDGAQGKGAVAIGEKALAAKGGTVSIGRNAHILGNGGNTSGEGSVAIGDNSLITTNGLDLASIALGKNAKVLNGSGKQERGLSFTPDNFDKPGFFGRGNTLPKNADKVPGGIAIGTNTFARTGSIQLGHHTFAGYKMGGIDVTKANEEANIVGMTTIGTNTYNKGALANMYGAYSIITGKFTGEGGFNSLSYGAQNFGANVVGSLNSIRSADNGSAGIANSIVGVANTVENANGTLVYGAGNKISNSITSISAPDGLTTLNTWEDTVTTLQKSIKDSKSGGAVLAIGGGNVADYVRHSQLVGVNNTVTGTENKVSEYNMVDGYKNTVTNGTHVTMIGSENTATDSESTLIMGDKQKVTKVKHGVLLGSQDAEKETTVSDVVAIGHNAHVEKEGGIALGSGSIAKRDKGAFGYDVATGKVLDEAGAAAALGDSAALKPLTDTYTAAKAAYEQAKQAVDAKQQEVEAIEKVCGKMCVTGENADKKSKLKHELNKLKTTLTEKQKAYEESQTAINNSLYTWKSTAAAVAVGDEEKRITRQITGVAAGTEDTDAVNVAQLKALATLPMNMYFGGKVENNTYTPGNTKWSMPLNEFRMDFGDGVKATQVTDKDGKKYTFVTLDKESLKNDPAFKGDKGADGAKGADGKSAYQLWKEQQNPDGSKPNENSSEQDFINSLKGKDGKDGKSAYQLWKEQQNPDGSKPNENSSEQDFINSLKGKDGKDGKSAYQLWKEQQNPDGSKPNENSSEQDFINSLKGKDGKDGKSAYQLWKEQQNPDGSKPNENSSEQEFLNSLKGKDGTGADIDIKGDTDSGVSVTPKTEAGKKTYTIALGTTIKAGEVTIDGTKDKENVAVGDVKINGEKGKSTITGLSNKTWDGKNIVSGRAATEDQLQQVAAAVAANATTATDFRLVKAGTTKDVDGTKDYTVSKDGKIMLTVQDKNHKDQLQEIGITDVARKSDVDKMLKEGFTVGEAGKPGKDGTNGKVEVVGKDGSAVVINGKDGSIGLNGKDGKDGIGINGKDGGSITIHGTNGADGQDGQNGVTIRGIDGKNGEKGEKGVDGKDVNRIVTVDPNGTKHQVATLDDGLKFAGDSGDAIAKKLNETFTISGGVAEEKQLTDKNIGVVAKDGKLNVKLVKNLTGLESATFTKTVKNGDKEEITSTVINDLGTTVTDKDGNKTVTTANGITITAGEKNVSLTKDGLNNGNQVISGVADGVKPDDAANMRQLSLIGNKIGNLDSRLNAVGAGSAALAALHPLDFDAQDKWNFAAGFGNYMGANALALGAFYRPNETTQFSIGGSFGNGENMINAGVSLKVGKGSLPISSKVEMARQLTAQAQEIERLQQKDKERDMVLDNLQKYNKEQSEKITAMNDIVQQLQKEIERLKHK